MVWHPLPPTASPAEQLCWEEAILDAVDAGALPEGASTWTSPRHAVVLGCGQKRSVEARTDRCEALGIPILRRCSGGGAVLLGPGCLSYALFLRIPETGPLSTIQGTNRWIMERQAEWLGAVSGLPVEVRGHSDLAVAGRKFSGNAQRRKRSALLFHGTLLHDFELPRIPECLAPPSLEPDYREGRGHLDFVRNLPTDPESLSAGFRSAWGATGEAPALPEADFQRLWEQRYSRASWHERL